MSVELAWLSGLIDGDGMIGFMRKQRERHQKEEFYYFPIIEVVTDCAATQRHLHDLGKDYQLGHKWYERKKKHIMWTMRIHGMQRCLRVLPMLMPYLVTKNQEAKFVLRFIESRMSHALNDPYTQEEKEIADKVRELRLERSHRTG